jgi:hypothetical protein
MPFFNETSFENFHVDVVQFVWFQLQHLQLLYIILQVDCTRASREINEENSIFSRGIEKRKLGRGL